MTERQLRDDIANEESRLSDIQKDFRQAKQNHEQARIELKTFDEMRAGLVLKANDSSYEKLLSQESAVLGRLNRLKGELEAILGKRVAPKLGIAAGRG